MTGWQGHTQGLHIASGEGYFQHKTLQNSLTQVRLLRLLAKPEGRWQTESSVWDRETAPRYVAVSYTWGEKLLQEVTIDDVPVLIRTNCFQALEQVWKQWPTVYVWIDAICIDQLNHAEKSKQVEMMFDTYRDASLIAVSLGAHENDSEWMLAIVRLLGLLLVQFMESHDMTWRHNDEKTGGNLFQAPLWSSFLATLGRGELVRLFDAMKAFAEREYWGRLWILQELSAAFRTDGTYAVYILCGGDSISALVLGSVFGAVRDIDGETGTPYWDAEGTRPKTVLPYGHIRDLELALMCITEGPACGDLTDRLAYFSWHSCSDPRDRLFGLLRLVDWGASGLKPILPDYSKTPWQVAEMAANSIALEDMFDLLDAMEISHDHEEMSGQIRQRFTGYSERSRSFNDTSQECWRPVAVQRDMTYCARLARVNGILVAAFGKYQGDLAHRRSVRPSDAISMSNILEHGMTLHRDWSPQFVHTPEGNFAAMLCNEAREGDVLVTVAHPDKGVVLVLRRRPHYFRMWDYDVVGQGVLINDYGLGLGLHPRWDHFVPCKCTHSHGLFVAFVQLRLTACDALFLVGQDVDDNNTCDHVARLFRLVTTPCTSPVGAAKIEDESCAGLEQGNAESGLDLSD